MDIEEARSWLRGERSICNGIPSQEDGSDQVIQAQGDAANTQQAYWIMKAHSEFKGVL